MTKPTPHERHDEKDLAFLDIVDGHIPDPSSLRIGGELVKKRKEIEDLLERDVRFDWKGSEELLRRIKQTDNFNLNDLETAISGRVEDLNRVQLEFLLKKENRKLLELRIRQKATIVGGVTRKGVVKKRIPRLSDEIKQIKRQIKILEGPDIPMSRHTTARLAPASREISTEAIKQKMMLVRQKLSGQIKLIESLEKSENEGDQLIMIRAQMESLSYFFDQFLKDADILTGNERYFIKGYFVKSIRQKVEDGELIEALESLGELYKLIQGSLRKGYEKSHQTMERRLQKLCKDYKEDLVQEIQKLSIEILAEDEELNDEDVEELLAKGIASNGVDFAEGLSKGLSEIYMGEFYKTNSELNEEIEKEIDDEETGKKIPLREFYDRSISRIKENLKTYLIDFRTQKYTIDYYLKQISGSVAGIDEKLRLRDIVRYLENELGEDEGDIKKKLRELTGKKKLNEFLEKYAGDPKFIAYKKEKDPFKPDTSIEKGTHIQRLPEIIESLKKITAFKTIMEARDAVRLLAHCGKLEDQKDNIVRAIKNTQEPKRENERGRKPREQFEEELARFPTKKKDLIKEIDKLSKTDKKHADEDLGPAEKEARKLDSNPYIDGDALGKVKEELEAIKKISDRKFSKGKKDFDEFEKRLIDIDRHCRGEYYYETKDFEDEKGRLLLHDGQQVYKQVKKAKEIPPTEVDELDKLLLQKYNFDPYKKFLCLGEGKDGLKVLENVKDNDENLIAALSALFSDFYNLGPENEKQAKLLSKVMSLNHPMTAIRFNAADQKPFMAGAKYQYHRVHGKAATFKGRAVELIGQVKENLDVGNFSAVEKLFRSQELADRLYKDSIFFPVATLREDVRADKFDRETLTFQAIEEPPGNGRFERRISKKIPGELKKAFEELYGSRNLSATIKKYDQDELLHDLPTQLISDEKFYPAFHNIDTEEKRKKLLEEEKSLRWDDEGNLIPETAPEGAERELVGAGVADADFQMREFETGRGDGAIRSLGIPPGAGRIPPERLQQVIDEYPIVGNRMARLHTELGAWALGGAEALGKTAYTYGRLVPAVLSEGVKSEWKNVQMVSAISVYMAIDQAIEHIGKIAEFHAQYNAYRLLANVFEGTIVGSEFSKLQQQKEDERVNQFKEAFDNYGHNQIVNKLYTAKDRFELKATLKEGFENRGVFTIEDLLDRRFIRNLNKHTPTVRVPDGWDEETMNENEAVRLQIINKIREGIDEIWGEGTWQGWRNAGSSKYESTRQETKKTFEGNSVSEKFKWYEQYWEWLKTSSGRKKLRKMHPAELVGNSEQDMLQGDNDWGNTAAILQAFICEGFIKLEHVRRLQTEHTNSLPIHTLLEPKEAKYAGLDKHVKEALANHSYGTTANNPLNEFYQGYRALKLRGYRDRGKWRFPRTKEDYEEVKDKMEDIVVTAHQLQKNREAQPEYHLKMDNCCIGMFSPCYPWSQIQTALSPDTSGKIHARPHDISAAYRGIHLMFCGYMNALADPSLMKDKTTFLRTTWQAYEALCKTSAYAGFLCRQKGRGKEGTSSDWTYNQLDGSPNFDRDHKEERASTGQSNFEELVIGCDGPHQRMSESNEMLDSMEDIDGDLRREFKLMAGYQHVASLGGVNPVDGKAAGGVYKQYNIDTFDPAGGFKKVMPLFLKNVQALAVKAGLGDEVSEALGRSGMDLEKAKKDNLTNEKRQAKLKNWLMTDAQLYVEEEE